MRIRNPIVAVLAFFSLLAGVLGLAGCAASSVVPDGQTPYEEIRNLASGLALWHFNSSRAVDGILFTAHKLNVQITASDLNVILDEDERKRLQRIDGIERSLSDQFGVRALLEFKVRHARAVADLWVEAAGRTGIDTSLGKAHLAIAAQYLNLGVRSLETIPTAWYCWSAIGCTVTERSATPSLIPMDPALLAEGLAAADNLARFSQSPSTSAAELTRIRDQASAWEGKLYAALEALP
jgi:hypothetical protein